MSERLAHWDDDLITAVCSAAAPEFEDGPYTLWLTSQQVFRIIAAVEDWQKKRWASITQSPMEVAVQFNALEAAIQRVREVCEQSRAVAHVGCRCSTDECSGKCGAGKPLAWDLDPADVLRALDGAE